MTPPVIPATLLDARGTSISALQFPPESVLVFAGVPGAGKSTALHRLFAADPTATAPVLSSSGALVLDSHQSRNRLRPRLGRVPYGLWRPVVHLAHYRAINNAMRTTRSPVAIHDCATFGWSRAVLAKWARDHDRQLHLVLIDVPADAARQGQIVRGRRVNSIAFAGHVRRWERLMHQLGAREAPATQPNLLRDITSATIVDRETLAGIASVTFAKAN
ncbi:AAA family ATPase [Nocardia camponoti]|uniref:AAA family ATPase n=1 Tax=Nocardia camponoti TaxID=1616106 RepID=UPI001E50DCAD|nr:AAA family ATPase [Nocardia camponoti]